LAGTVVVTVMLRAPDVVTPAVF